jgi:hypothetical protein
MSITDDAALLLAPSAVIHHSLTSCALSLAEIIRALLLAPSVVLHNSFKIFNLDPLLDPEYEPIQVSSIPAATNPSAGAMSGPRGVWSTDAPVIPDDGRRTVPAGLLVLPLVPIPK